MAWSIEIDKDVQRFIEKLDKPVARRIAALLLAASLDDPRSQGRALTGNLAGLWRYRVGDYRMICDIEDGVMLILVVDLEHRSRVYRRRR